MKILFVISFLLLSLIALPQSVCSALLMSKLSNEYVEDEYLDVNVFFVNYHDMGKVAARLDASHALFDERVKTVNRLLRENSEFSQQQILPTLDAILKTDAAAIADVQFCWSVNVMNLMVKAKYVYRLADDENVRFIDLNTPRYHIVDGRPSATECVKAVGGVEPGLQAINAPLMWQRGYTGRNMLFLSVDTGVSFRHPAIRDNFAGNNYPLSQCWYAVRHAEPVDNNTNGFHGTHTTGTVLGLDRATHDTIGVAFNAKWIATDPVASSESELLNPMEFMTMFQWVLNPDGDESTTYDVPRVINNSWGYEYALASQFINVCEMPEAAIIADLETAGICSPFSAGNEGPDSITTGFPAVLVYNEVNPMAVAALQTPTTIASFSSRGPSPCSDTVGSLKIKPEVAAPGHNVRSCVGTDAYRSYDGTSMACPHVTGALLLLAEAFPTASAYQLKKALYMSAVDLGEPGEDNTFGNGRIDVNAAFNYLTDVLHLTPTPPITNAYDLAVDIATNGEVMLCVDTTATQEVDVNVVNSGENDIDGYQLHVYLNDVECCDTTVAATLTAGASHNLAVPIARLQHGKNTVRAAVTPLSTLNEFDIFNNSRIKSFYVLQQADFPYVTHFHSVASLADDGITVVNPDYMNTWCLMPWGENDEHKAMAVNFARMMPAAAQHDFAYLPEIQLPNGNKDLFLNFTYSYKKRNNFSDSLFVELFANCDTTAATLIYVNGGRGMATIPGNSGGYVYKPTADTAFDTVAIPLNDYKGQKVLIRFKSQNAHGSVLYLDKISIADSAVVSVVEPLAAALPQVYPNPTTGLVTICNTVDNEVVEVYNALGLKVDERRFSAKVGRIDLSRQPAGIYFMVFKNAVYRQKIVLQ